MIKPEAKIRVDGGGQLGWGHVIRSLSLAHMLVDHANITFYLLSSPTEILDHILSKGFHFIKLSNEDEFLNNIKTGELVVLDGYEFDSDYQKKIKRSNAFLICIDDLFKNHFHADIVINHAPQAKEGNYSKDDHTMLLCGPEYALLRPEFIEAARSMDESTKPKGSVFMSFGGSDPNNFTCRTARSILAIPELNLNVVTGASFMHRKEFSNLQKNYPDRLINFSDVSAKEMVSLMSESEILIVPASGILLEAISLRKKIVFGMTADNQKHLYEGFKNVQGLFAANQFDEKDIFKSINKAFPSKGCPDEIIDGKSPKRIIHEILMKILKFRTVESGDCGDLYQWANDPNVRAASYHSDPIKYEDHEKWFNLKISDPNSHLLVFSFGINKIGLVRFDLIKDIWVVGITIGSEYRGMGLASVMLTLGSNYICSMDAREIHAYIKKDNLKSLKSFERSGYIRIGDLIHHDQASFLYAWK